MIDGYKDLCKIAANKIPGWENLSKNELCRLCIKHEDDEELFNAYYAAIMYNYCPTITKYYRSCKGIVDEATCKDWMEDAINYALRHRRWEDPDSTIYGDPNGPDKVINRRMKCTRVNFFQYVSRKKRKDSYKTKSLDAIAEMVNDNTLEIMDKESANDSPTFYLKDYIKRSFMKKDYFIAYLLDCIINSNVFFYNKETSQYELSTKKLARAICSIDEDYCERFADDYSLPQGLVKDTLKYFYRVSPTKITYKIEYSIQKLKHDEVLSRQLKGM